MLVNIHRINTHNCGDMAASPLRYFDLPKPSVQKCISFLSQYSPNDFVVLGGGGLFYDEWHAALEQFFQRHQAPLVVWAAGLNYHHTKDQAVYPEFLSKATLVGVRDYDLGYRWVPCPSCMHPFFDATHRITEKTVVFEHIENSLHTDLPKFTNNRTMEEAIRFLGSAEQVITNSYHGVYWATLLRKKVVALPVAGSSRFYKFRHAPVLTDTMQNDFVKARIYDESLRECRDANLAFYRDVLCLIRKNKIY